MHGLGPCGYRFKSCRSDQEINIMKYNERQIIQHLEDYIDSTYSQHYTKGDFQIQDLFEHIDIAEEFCRGAQSNILFVLVEKRVRMKKTSSSVYIMLF